ncbi:MAG: 3-hydroxyisobutyrate dehydrogenase [Microbacterium sp. SCN 70-200]|uniref:NAD(P)-dependent oxidoreductase n=1 Tax=unclassified Microbacterium TaxID=2609290 RepID=UPI00086D9A2F|nr:MULTISPECIES: NAD(P)-binding domain-containing protein [unclassified Microbacterium]MBN9215978.1 NAD-binding protein [Microbacterium sp.]ODT41831.1 MAG: 3-hydroxyisobutyrate dehydrogenase [Microbacterium sp. SCN 70-200]OJV84520.1 MAG: 3-hydroxyisobutyrate dehydrogenase [Microbacterium sp. 70-16]
MSTIAFIGLGRMGAPMAAHLIAAGHTVRGVEINPTAAAIAAEHGVELVDTVAAALAGADAVLTSLPKPEHVRSVYGGPDGIFAHAPASALLMDTSTVDVATSRWCHDEAAARGLTFVDAPISGGTAGAAAGSLTFMLGGRPDDVERARAVVEPMAGNIIACGDAGAGIAAKLVNNMMLFISVMAMSEGSQLAEELGLDARTFWEVARVSSGDSWALRTWYPVPGVVERSAANNNFDPTFSVDLARKDCGLAVQAGDVTGVHLPAARLALSQLDELIAQGLGGKDCTLVATFASPDGTLRGYDPARDAAPAHV